MARTIYRSLIGHEDFSLGTGKITQKRGDKHVVIQQVELPFIFRTVDEIKALDYLRYVHIGLHITGAVIEYYFDPNSYAVNDDDLVIKPTNIQTTQAGRYIKVLPSDAEVFVPSIVYTHTRESYTIQHPHECVLVDSSAGPIIIVLPPFPITHNYAGVWDAGVSASTNHITIQHNGNTIINLFEDASIDMTGGRFDFIWKNNTWEFAYVLGCTPRDAPIIADTLFLTSKPYPTDVLDSWVVHYPDTDSIGLIEWPRDNWETVLVIDSGILTVVRAWVYYTYSEYWETSLVIDGGDITVVRAWVYYTPREYWETSLVIDGGDITVVRAWIYYTLTEKWETNLTIDGGTLTTI